MIYQRSVLFPFLLSCYQSPAITSDLSFSDDYNSNIYLSYCLNFSSSSSYERLQYGVRNLFHNNPSIKKPKLEIAKTIASFISYNILMLLLVLAQLVYQSKRKEEKLDQLRKPCQSESICQLCQSHHLYKLDEENFYVVGVYHGYGQKLQINIINSRKEYSIFISQLWDIFENSKITITFSPKTICGEIDALKNSINISSLMNMLQFDSIELPQCTFINFKQVNTQEIRFRVQLLQNQPFHKFWHFEFKGYRQDVMIKEQLLNLVNKSQEHIINNYSIRLLNDSYFIIKQGHMNNIPTKIFISFKNNTRFEKRQYQVQAQSEFVEDFFIQTLKPPLINQIKQKLKIQGLIKVEYSKEEVLNQTTKIRINIEK